MGLLGTTIVAGSSESNLAERAFERMPRRQVPVVPRGTEILDLLGHESTMVWRRRGSLMA